MKSGEGTLLAFATGPGQTALDGEAGTNSPFTRALLANIAQPGVEIQQAMTKVRAQVNEETSKSQLPWGHTNLTGSVYLNPAKGAATEARTRRLPAATGLRSRTRVLALDQGLQQGRRAQRLSDQLSERHLQADRAGPHRLAAGRPVDRDPRPHHRCPASIPRPSPKKARQVTEDMLSLNKMQRRDVQRRLTGLGFDIKATGKFDEETRSVISRWQAARGYPKTGYLNALQHKALSTEILATRVASVLRRLPMTSRALPAAAAVAEVAAAVTIVAAAAVARPLSSA